MGVNGNLSKNTAGERVHPHTRMPLHERCSGSIVRASLVVVSFPLLDVLLFRPVRYHPPHALVAERGNDQSCARVSVSCSSSSSCISCLHS